MKIIIPGDLGINFNPIQRTIKSLKIGITRVSRIILNEFDFKFENMSSEMSV